MTTFPHHSKRASARARLLLAALALVVAVALIVAVAVTGCGGGDGDTGTYGERTGASDAAEQPDSGTRATGAAADTAEGAAVVSVAGVPGLGQILVDGDGRTLYDFHKDKGTASSCYGACAEAWPPLTSEGKPQSSKGAEASLLGTTKRRDSTVQVTYAGRPLYTFSGDRQPGEANGNGVDAFGAEWYALTPNGTEPEGGGTPPPPSTY